MGVEPQERVGEVLDEKYRIEEYLGGGAMGSVYRAKHVKFGRSFAIKVLHHRLRSDPKLVRRFAREAEVAAKLNHPNVVSVLDVNDEAGTAYMVMELAPGVQLGELLGAPFARDRALALFRQLCDGLNHAHDLGLVHRDLKPDNVIVEQTDDGEVARIVDFGIAILREAAEAPRDDRADRITSGGIVLGTPQYMAPELATGGTFDHRADLFALGVICFQMLTGRAPFDGSGVEVAMANITRSTPAMGVRVPQLVVDPLLEAFTHKLLAKKPEERFATAGVARAMCDLIARDPVRAAKALGVQMLSLVDHSGPHQRKPRGSTGQDALFGDKKPAPPIELRKTQSQEQIALGQAKTQAIDTLEQPAAAVRSRRGLVLAAAGVAAAVVTSLVLLGSSKSSSPEPVTAAAAIDEAQPPSAAAVAREVAPAPVEAVDSAAKPAPAPVDKAEPVRKPAPARVRTKAIAKPEPQVTKAVTAADVAGLYGAVGRQLKSLAQKPGVDELWAKYRTIRIHDALATPAAIEQANRLLVDIRDQAAKL